MDIVLFVIKCYLSESGRTSDTAAATVIVAVAARLAVLLLFRCNEIGRPCSFKGRS